MMHLTRPPAATGFLARGLGLGSALLLAQCATAGLLIDSFPSPASFDWGAFVTQNSPSDTLAHPDLNTAQVLGGHRVYQADYSGPSSFANVGVGVTFNGPGYFDFRASEVADEKHLTGSMTWNGNGSLDVNLSPYAGFSLTIRSASSFSPLATAPLMSLTVVSSTGTDTAFQPLPVTNTDVGLFWSFNDFSGVNWASVQAISLGLDIVVPGGGDDFLEYLVFFNNFNAVPEPHTTALLCGLGLLGFAGFRRFRQRV